MDIDMAHNTPNASPCATYALLLPLVQVNELRLDDRPDLRDHLASCARCQARLAGYDVVDGALRRQFTVGAVDGRPIVSFADVAQRVAREGDGGEGVSERTRNASSMTGVPTPRRVQRGTAHRWLAAIGPIAAVLVISMLAVALFAQHRPGSSGSPTIPAALHGKTVYVGTEDGVYAVRADDGSLRWHYPAGAPTTHNPLPISTIALANGTLYVAERPWEYGDALGAPYVTIQAMRASDGALGWSARIPGVTATLTVADGVVFASVTETVQGSDANHFVYALRASDGKQVEKYRTDEPIVSAPAVANGVVYVATTGFVYALRERDMTVKWRSIIGAGAQLEGYQASGIWSAAIYAQGNIVYVNAKAEIKHNDNALHFEPVLFALSATDGSHFWRDQGDGTGADPFQQAYTPTLVNGVIYGELSWGLWATRVSASRDDIVWIHRTDSPVVGPTVADGVVYVCDIAGYTYALRASNGDELWRTMTQGGTMSQPPAVAGGAVFSDGGTKLYALRADDGKVLWRFMTNGGILLMSPIVGP